MNLKKINKTKSLIIALFIFALAGGIFFMPVQLNGKYTCFYHRLFDENQPVTVQESEAGVMQSGQKEERPGEGFSIHHSHGEEMVDMYISRYAFFWWGSVALLALAIYIWIKNRDDKSVTNR